MKKRVNRSPRRKLGLELVRIYYYQWRKLRLGEISGGGMGAGLREELELAAGFRHWNVIERKKKKKIIFQPGRERRRVCYQKPGDNPIKQTFLRHRKRKGLLMSRREKKSPLRICLKGRTTNPRNRPPPHIYFLKESSRPWHERTKKSYLGKSIIPRGRSYSSEVL